MLHGQDERGTKVPSGRFARTGRFGRMFPELRSLKRFKPSPEHLGRAGGPMDGGTPPPTDTSQNNPRIKAGYTFLGQFIDHDITFDPTSILERQIDPQATHNFRTPAFELDSVYGLGPAAQPYLYDREKPFRFLTASAGDDLPRNPQGAALIGDPRNDENIIISQLHLLFLKFHNRVFDEHTDPNLSLRERFDEAQRLVRWHYQWIVLNEFLARLVGTQTAALEVEDPAFTFPGEPFMPLEFSVAAYRFGHSQLRPGYRVNTRGAVLFPSQPNAPFDPDNLDLRGGRPVPAELVVDWANFFGAAAAPGLNIDTKLSTPMLRLPDSVVGPSMPENRRSLATRNLQRGIDARLPAGQTVATYLRIPNPLTEAEIWAGVPDGEGLAPLWFYVLREAELRGGGQRLAGVGAAIVSRVFVALMLADRASYLAQDPLWTPTLPSSVPGSFTMTDLVNLTLDPDTTLAGEDVDALPGDDRPTVLPIAAE